MVEWVFKTSIISINIYLQNRAGDLLKEQIRHLLFGEVYFGAESLLTKVRDGALEIVARCQYTMIPCGFKPFSTKFLNANVVVSDLILEIGCWNENLI
ncbi:conserved hypothetical protein [Ricinus communis]|uniref:Uncharacterized protein n=1 Tax=Ricinus communis TaxID=3988 RepID=B9T1P2_RICCO|nr:conserved hypothetical protein [Ricinus communis]